MYLVQDLRAHQEPIWVAKFSPCGTFLATGSKDGQLKIWEMCTFDDDIKSDSNKKTGGSKSGSNKNFGE